MSSCGRRRRSSTSRRKYSCISTRTRRWRAICSGGRGPMNTAPRFSTAVSDHTLNWPRSSAGMPMISAMTMTGSGYVSASTRSTRPRASAASTSSSAIAFMRGSSRRMMRGVNAWLTSPRSRVCAGGSVTSMLGGRSSAVKPGGGGNAFDQVAGSRRTPWMSSWRKIETTGAPAGAQTGCSRRARAYRGNGSRRVASSKGSNANGASISTEARRAPRPPCRPAARAASGGTRRRPHRRRRRRSSRAGIHGSARRRAPRGARSGGASG